WLLALRHHCGNADGRAGDRSECEFHDGLLSAGKSLGIHNQSAYHGPGAIFMERIADHDRERLGHTGKKCPALEQMTHRPPTWTCRHLLRFARSSLEAAMEDDTTPRALLTRRELLASAGKVVGLTVIATPLVGAFGDGLSLFAQAQPLIAAAGVDRV